MRSVARAESFVEPGMSVEARSGFSPAIDEAAGRAPPGHAFLRRAWFERAGPVATTLIGRRGDGSIFGALPLVPMGPAMLGVRMIAGSYWPFRTAPIAADASDAELRTFLGDPVAARALGQVWRMGPYHADDPAAAAIEKAARGLGWILLRRELGTSFVIDIPALARAGEWPRRSTVRRVRTLERQLVAQGDLSFRFVRSEGWDEAALDALATIEEKSWVGTRTDRSGAKFLGARQREHWTTVLRDPDLADMLSAVILFVGEVPAAFSFDLNVGRLQYGLASSYDARFARWGVGKIATLAHLEESRARGVEIVDWGSGDSGYKSELGAQPGPEIVDGLFVRSRTLATILRPRWLKPMSAGSPVEDSPLLSRREQLIVGAIVTAAAVASFSE